MIFFDYLVMGLGIAIAGFVIIGLLLELFRKK